MGLEKSLFRDDEMMFNVKIGIYTGPNKLGLVNTSTNTSTLYNLDIVGDRV